MLGLETSTTLLSVALVEDDLVRVELTLDAGLVHAERLAPVVEDLLGQLRLQAPPRGIAVSLGPGSFTGLRIGLAMAKGLARGWGASIAGVPTLEALATMAWPSPYRICPLLDARKGEVYGAVYRGDQACGPVAEGPFLAAAPQDFLKAVAAPALFLGSGAALYRDLIVDVLGSRAHFLVPNPLSARASMVAVLGARRLGIHGPDRIEDLEPLYLRPSEAELRPGGDGLGKSF
jgi:tRNA threonylcarbamoyladenosine biosynthesis protein TsaB